MIRLMTAALCSISTTLTAETPIVVTDFAPVYSLTAQVMQGVGTPQNLLPPGAEPHHYNMTPSDAAGLTDADLVIWTGAGLTPWLADPIASLAPDARQLILVETEGWDSLPLREAAVQADLHELHDDAHDHGTFDPHAWLDPLVAAVWVGHIAETLAGLDPEHAATYHANAAAAQEDLQRLTEEIAATLQSADGGYILPHDGYQYFESRFGIVAAASIATSDAREPGPARINDLRELIRANDIRCILTDRETNPAWATLLTEGTDARTAEIDGTAANYPIGPRAYADMMRTLAGTIADCLG